MGRTNLIILFLGLFGCVALSLMMKHVVVIKKKHVANPALAELHTVFQDQLNGPPVLAFEDVDQRRVAVLTIDPAESIERASVSRFARTMGRYFSQVRGQDVDFDELIVVAKTGDSEQRLAIELPRKGPRAGRSRPSKKNAGSGTGRASAVREPAAPGKR